MSSERRRAMDGPSVRAVEQAGEKTFGAFFEKSGSFQSNSPKPEGRNSFEVNGLASPCLLATVP